MWAIQNNTPFAAERCWVRDKNGAEVWLVAVRGTFDIGQDGEISLSKEQTEVVLAPRFRGDPVESSLLFDTDLPHKKLTTDILLHGHAYAPNGEPATTVDVTMKVAQIQKKLRVFGDRVWDRVLLTLAMSPPKPFAKMPISYERAFGGADRHSDDPMQHDWEKNNPVGRGFMARMEHLSGKFLPNVESPRELIRFWKDRPQPAGFGPIAGHWAQRLRYAGTYDEQWKAETQPLLPNDFDERYYQCAPFDQQAPEFLRGGEQVELLNLDPSGVMRFQLPRVTLGFRTHFFRGDVEFHRPTLHTVLFEPDVRKVSMVWHTQLPCHHKVLKLRATVIDIKKRLNAPQGVWSGL